MARAGIIFKRPFDYPNLEAETEEGFRTYLTPYGNAPSVTSILGRLPNPGLDAWKARVGIVEARRVSQESTTIGKYMHAYLEDYLDGKEIVTPANEMQKEASQMFIQVRQFGLKDLKEVWGVEDALYCHDLYAGRTDLLGIYQNLPAIIDFKTSKRMKTMEYIHHYKLQTAAYAVAHREMFGEDTYKIGVILIGIRPSQWGPAKCQRFIIEEDEFDHCKQEWMTVVENFYDDESRS